MELNKPDPIDKTKENLVHTKLKLLSTQSDTFINLIYKLEERLKYIMPCKPQNEDCESKSGGKDTEIETQIDYLQNRLTLIGSYVRNFIDDIII